MKSGIIRFLRVVLAGAIAYGLQLASNNLALLPDLPAWCIPLITSVINGIGKWVRSTFGVKLPI